MRIPGVKTAKALSRQLRARFLGGALILGYHRIALSPAEADVYEVCVSPENFAEHLSVLRKYTYPLSLSELIQQLKNGSLRSKSIAVTFDDGYADNLYSAKPLLEKYEIPATVFICSGTLGREFWWDELNRLVVSSSADLRALHLQMSDNHLEWIPPPFRNDDAIDGHVSMRRQFRHALYHSLLLLDVADRERVMQIIRDWSGVSLEGAADLRTMDSAELVQMAAGGLVELGSHTRNHPMLPWLPLERQKEEIIWGKRDLETLLGRPVDGFAYPNGRATEDARQIVREAGFSYACVSLHDVVRPGSDLYSLTRFWQKDVNGDRFLQGLISWMKISDAYA